MEKLVLKNFKVFEKEVIFDLAPITILTGKNNAGKSSTYKALLLLNDYLSSENQLQLAFDGMFAYKHKINVFENAKTWNSESKSISFSFLHNGMESNFQFGGNNEDAFAELESYSAKVLEIDDVLELKRISKSQFELKVSQLFIDHLAKNPRRDSPQESLPLFDLENELKELKGVRNTLMQEEDKVKKGSKEYIKIRSELQNINKRIGLIEERIESESASENKRGFVFQSIIELNDEEDNRSLVSLIRRGLLEYFTEEKKDKKGTLRYTSGSGVSMTLYRFAEQMHRKINFSVSHLSPNRFKQERLYIKNDESEINKALSDYASHKPRKGSQADTFLKKWLKEFEIGEDIEVKNVEGSASTVYIKRKDENRLLNLADMGFGAGQILTILLKITNIINDRINQRFNRRFPFAPIILIEEPETNLHPYVQSKLAELFFEAIKEYGMRFMLETHSEYLIRKFQTLVATEKMLSTDCVLYYIDKIKVLSNEGNASKNINIGKINIREDGSLSSEFGEGFFDEADKHAMELYRIVKTKSEKK